MSRAKIVIGFIAVSLALGLLFTVLPAIADSPTVTEFPVCINTSDQWNPDVSGDIVVWRDARNGNLDIYGYNLSSAIEFPICTNSSDQDFPAVSGNIVVWQDKRNGNWDIYGYNLSSSTEFAVCTNPSEQDFPAVSGNIVVWQDHRNDLISGWDIYGKNLSTSTEFSICTDSADQYSPAVSGSIVTWFDWRNYNYDIYGKNLSSSIEFPICTNSSDQRGPAVSGDVVVWDDSRSGMWQDIYGKNLSSSIEFPICTNSSDQHGCAISGDIVVWLDNRNGWPTNPDIYGYNLSSSTEFPVCTNLSGQYSPAISGNIVIWQDKRNGNLDIYGATLGWPTPTPTPTVSPTISPTVSPTATVSPTPTPTATTEWWSIPYHTVGGKFVTIYSLYCTAGPITVNSSDFPYTEMTINISKGNATGGYRDVVIDRDSFVSDTFNITLTGMSAPVILSLSDDATGKLYVQGSTGDVDVFSNTTEGGTNFTFGDGTLDVAGSLLLDMPLVGDFDLAGQHKILSMDTNMTTNYSYNNAIRPGCNINNSVADGYGIAFMQDGGPSPYVGTDGTIIGTLSVLNQRLIGVEWDFQFKLVMELEQVPNPGDVNDDGVINCCDITQVELCILYPETYPKENYPGWDANEDNEGPNAGDILAVEMRILGTWPPPP